MNYDAEPHGVYFFIDNKSFYASCESVARGLNPLTAILCVMSETANTNGGLILAASPRAKQLFGLHNVNRQYELPHDERLILVPPRMNLYIKKNLEINQIFTEFVAETDLLPYSIDESLLDMTHSWRLFGNTVQTVAQQIQREIKRRLGLYVTVGIGDNPVQAKLALDLYAKHNRNLIGELHYEDVPTKLWPIQNLTSVWGIGKRQAQRLARLGIHSMAELAAANPYVLKQELGVIGTQLFATAWGIDRSNLHEDYQPQQRSYSNGQVLPRDYCQESELAVVIKELTEQVAARVQAHHFQVGSVTLQLGIAHGQVDAHHLSHTQRIPATDQTVELRQVVMAIFKKLWHGETIRRINLDFGDLTPAAGMQLDLLADNQRRTKQRELDHVTAAIRKRFGVDAVFRAQSLCPGGTALERAGLVGGHSGGNSYE
ncbi:Y-family DNA polymerase [Fructilactobacillus carniphilus]|uniref:Y-family DNA polymerase n=1 Tax=Fructilactobacillus carniphilus TaxID=2940297 RepID=A0ABY5BXR8_9LACO|nr:Y-family DNA polymerase [Fructilactobacillus carniphilus]USS91016.1 Y-family DNA polymerase [Fructilactobacillus carniphilus]